MKNLILILAMVPLVALSQVQNFQPTFQFGYTNYTIKGQTNLNGFRAVYWPQQYRTPSYFRNNRVVNNNNNVGVFVDGVFTPSDTVKTNQQQALVGGLIMPLFDPGINIYLGFGSRWNSADGDEFNSNFIATYGISFIIPNRGLTLSIGRHNIARELFAKEGTNTTLGIGYTFRRQ